MNGDINLVAIFLADGFGVVLSIIMLGARIWKRDKNSMEVRRLRLMIYTAMSSCLADSLVFAFDGKPGMLVFVILYIGNAWLFVSNVVLGTLWVKVTISHLSGRDELPRYQRIMIFLLDVVGTVVIVINLFNPVVFEITEDNVYVRGPMFWLYVAIELFIVGDSLVAYFIYRKRTREAKHYPMWQFVIPLMSCIIAQAVMYGISLISPSVPLAICGVILGLFSENEEEADILRQNEINAKIIMEQQEQLEEALVLAQTANKSKTAFLNNMSHDIRTPMNAIIGYTGLMKNHIDDRERALDYLGKISKSSDYLLSLINEVLDMSRIESGKITLSEHHENLRKIFDGIEDIIETDVKKHNHKLIIDMDGIVDEEVKCDKLRFSQILINILANAIKYTPDNGTISLTVTEEPDSSHKSANYRISIKDNGVGMSQEYLKTIFEPFTRVQSSTESGIQGTGLGMTITRNLVDMMGGDIAVDSTPGEGTEVTVSFQFAIVDGTEDEQGDTSARDKDGNIDLTGVSVLLVEDNELNREIAMEILKEKGCVVDYADDGDIAVEIMKKAAPGAYRMILMDIQMPRMDGYEATRKIREVRPKEEFLPIIAMTANAFDEDRKLALSVGMDDYIAKPINQGDLFAVIAKHL